MLFDFLYGWWFLFVSDRVFRPLTMGPAVVTLQNDYNIIISWGTHTPRAIAWGIPNLGTFRAQRGLKWSDVQIFPPLYIFAVFPSNSGKAISGAVVGYVTGICNIIYTWFTAVNQPNWFTTHLLTSNSTSNSYRSNWWMYHTFPNHLVPSLFESSLNQSLSFCLFCSTYCNYDTHACMGYVSTFNSYTHFD